MKKNTVQRLGPILVNAALAGTALHAGALKVDINRGTKNQTTYTETGFVNWSSVYTDTPASGTNADTRVFTSAAGETVTVTLAQTAASAATGGLGLRTGLYQAGGDAGVKLASDGVEIDVKDIAAPQNVVGQIQMTITGLNAGTHSLLTYHNHWDSPTTLILGPIDISVNGSLVIDDLQPTIRAASNNDAASAYVPFTVTGPSDITTILFAADPTAGSGSVNRRTAVLSGFEIDTSNAQKIAHTPTPADTDEHVDGDSGSVTLSWLSALSGDTASHDVYFGTSEAAVATADHGSGLFLGNQPGNSIVVNVPDKHATYFWRIDEINTSAETTAGTVWSFRPRVLAFPGAEGHGRFARGGRGGKVVHVTSLADYGSSDTPVPGTLRYAIEVETEPRVVVFDTSGMITLVRKLTMSDENVTIAGQTAPGKGICIRQYALGLSGADDAIVRFLRNRPGNISGTTIDGGGLAGCDHSIMDHCSISWSIDEGFSGRGAKHITLQNTLISEALAIAGHSNYPPGTDHGYAATIGGDIASYHHNLLAHCSGRNWSLGGGLDAQNNFAGRLDIRNNVVYNWRSRTTDGGAMEVNFVNNYYKPGAATTFTPYAVTINHEDNFGGSQQCYFAGNIMQGYFNESNQTVGRRSVVDAGVPTPTYETFVSTPFFDHHVTTQTATGGYKRVLSDVGANRPIDDHDTRVIQETVTGTYTYTGTGPYGGYPGLPNSQDDVGGWEDYPTETRDAGWDTDGDGLPNWWEELHGSNPSSTPGSFSDANADPDGDGFTRLCDYLAWLALPRLEVAPGESVDLDLTKLTKGYTSSPVHGVTLAPESAAAGTLQLLGDGKTVRFTANAGFEGIASFTHTVT
ncbi:MAG: T9SS C-terminal target domain-containing protein, partial [Verrucomicrobiae bacterium]|nr:T9SS C-terminal target domain-containing protein [Verrucomicrobiae bacterium]